MARLEHFTFAVLWLMLTGVSLFFLSFFLSLFVCLVFLFVYIFNFHPVTNNCNLWFHRAEIIMYLCMCSFFLCAARKSLSPVLDSSGSLVVKRRSPEEMEKDLRGAEAATELSLHPKEGLGVAEGQLSNKSSNNFNLYLSFFFPPLGGCRNKL